MRGSYAAGRLRPTSECGLALDIVITVSSVESMDEREASPQGGQPPSAHRIEGDQLVGNRPTGARADQADGSGPNRQILYIHKLHPGGNRIGYVFRRDQWGRGYATEAVESLLTVLFAQRHAHRVIARCNPVNVSSWRLLERTGFRREAHMREAASFVDNDQGEPIWHDSYHYAILAHEWRAATSS